MSNTNKSLVSYADSNGELIKQNIFEQVQVKPEDNVVTIAKHVMVNDNQIDQMKEFIKFLSGEVAKAEKSQCDIKTAIMAEMGKRDNMTKMECEGCTISIPKPKPSMIGDDTDLRNAYDIPKIEEKLSISKSRLADEKKKIKERLVAGGVDDNYKLTYNKTLKIK